MESCIETTSSFEKTYYLSSLDGGAVEISTIISDFNEIICSFAIDNIYIRFHASDQDDVISSCSLDLDNIPNSLNLIQTMCNCSGDKVIVKLALKAQKKKSSKLQIIDVDSFLNSIEFNSILDQVKFWNEDVQLRFQTIKVGNVEFKNEFDNKRSSFSGLLSKTSTDLDSSGITVEYLTFLMDQSSNMARLFNHLVKVRNILCLIYMSNNDAIIDGVVRYGHNDFTIKDLSLDYHLDNADQIFRLYEWCFCDERHGTKLGIVNHIFSQSKSNPICFDDNLFAMIRSHYQFHLRNEFEGYLEIRNKLADSTLDICTRVSEHIGSIDKTVLQILFVILSYFFSIVVFTGIDKGKFENVFSLELASLTTVFIFGAVLVIWFSKNEYNKKIEMSRMQLKEIKNRNKYFLTEDEINDFFDSESLRTVLSDSDDRAIVAISYFMLAVLLCLVWFFYSTKTVFLSIPVLLHIV